MPKLCVEVEVKVKLVLLVEEGTDPVDIVNEMDYSFVDQTGQATIEETEILDCEIIEDEDDEENDDEDDED